MGKRRKPEVNNKRSFALRRLTSKLSGSGRVVLLAAICLANPQTNCFVSFDCYAGLGASTYVESEGLQGKFTVIGIDDAVENLRCMQQGTMAATVAQMWYKMGHDAVMLANDLRNGKEIPANTDSGTAIIMPDGIDAWVEEMGLDMGS